jgi:two-component system phosphate regulon sensor histidine kinase PhoR
MLALPHDLHVDVAAVEEGGLEGKGDHAVMVRGPTVRSDVTDEGEGVDPIHLPRLTERFYRVDSHRSREQGGTGLGLAIVRHIANRHRGRFRVERTLGEGSTFSVILDPAGGVTAGGQSARSSA